MCIRDSRYAGVNPANGDPLWYDKEGNLTTEFRESDNVMERKDYLAPWQGGFGTTLTWKGISVNAQFSWVADRWMFNLSLIHISFPLCWRKQL